MNTEHIKNTLQSKQYKHIVEIVCVIVATLIIFNLGMRIGYMKASYTNAGGENVYRQLTPGIKRHMPGFIQDISSGAHGANGKIISITLPTITVADKEGIEKIVRIEDQTILRSIRSDITENDLRVGDMVVVIGEPNEDTEISARFIRIVYPEVQTIR